MPIRIPVNRKKVAKPRNMEEKIREGLISAEMAIDMSVVFMNPSTGTINDKSHIHNM